MLVVPRLVPTARGWCMLLDKRLHVKRVYALETGVEENDQMKQEKKERKREKEAGGRSKPANL